MMRVSHTTLVRVLVAVLLALVCAAGVVAQQMPQPITVYTDYTIKPGRDADFMDLVNKIGGPVRDQMMKEGVVLAWGVDVPMNRGAFGGTTHTIWYAVADWASMEKVQTAMAAQMQKVTADEAKAAQDPKAKGKTPGLSPMLRLGEISDVSQFRDWYTRSLVFATGGGTMPAGTQIFTRYGFVQAKPGKGADYRAAWEKYNKPVYDKLLKDGVIMAYGLSVEELKSTNDFTHFSWVAMTNLAAADKLRAAFAADRDKRSAEEREAINATFAATIDGTASRGLLLRSLIFREPSMK